MVGVVGADSELKSKDRTSLFCQRQQGSHTQSQAAVCPQRAESELVRGAPLRSPEPAEFRNLLGSPRGPS